LIFQFKGAGIGGIQQGTTPGGLSDGMRSRNIKKFKPL
jgi:hypothetical protein